MPEISRFLGIVIAILYRDHEPPHFHAAHRPELEENWQLARDRKPLKRIEPLE